MTIRDRGNVKWTSLMLPEHVKALRKYINEDYYDIPEPTKRLKKIVGNVMLTVIFIFLQLHA
jgi:hypothetical protein